jgi:hypothetical protein
VVMNQFNILRLSESVWKSCTKIESQPVGIIFNSIILTSLATYRVRGVGATEMISPHYNFLYGHPCTDESLYYQMRLTAFLDTRTSRKE